MFLFRFLLPALLLADPVLAQSVPPCPDPATPGSSEQWVRAVGQLPLPQQLAAVRQRMLCDTAYQGFVPATCRVLLAGTVHGRSVPDSSLTIRQQPADARPPGPTLFYVVDGYAAGPTNTAASVADFWRRVAARPIRQVTLLPEAAAVALYGSRAANGAVVLSSDKPRRP